MKFSTAREIGFLVREARTREGISQSELARRNNTKQAWISELENGKSTVELGTVLQVMKDLKIELDATLAHTHESDLAASPLNQDEDDEYTPPPYTI